MKKQLKNVLGLETVNHENTPSTDPLGIYRKSGILKRDKTKWDIMNLDQVDCVQLDESMSKEDYDQYKNQELLDHYDIVFKRIESNLDIVPQCDAFETNLSDTNEVFENILSKDNSQRVMRAIENCYRSFPPKYSKSNANIVVSIIERGCLEVSPAVRNQLVWLIVNIERLE